MRRNRDSHNQRSVSENSVMYLYPVFMRAAFPDNLTNLPDSISAKMHGCLTTKTTVVY